MASNKTPEANELIASALQLPVSDRVTLVNAMLESMEDNIEKVSQSEIDKSWNDEIAHRVKDIESGNVDTVPSSSLWEQIGGKPNA